MVQESEPARPGATPSGARTSGTQSEQESDRQKGTGEDPDEDGDSGALSDGFTRLDKRHKALRALLGECENTEADEAEELLWKMCREWAQYASAHAALYDRAQDAGLSDFAPLNEAGIETDLVSFLLRRAKRDLEEPMQVAALSVAARMINNIIEREEKPRNGILAKVRAAGVDPDDLGRHIDVCRRVMGHGVRANRPQLRHLVVNQEDIMARNMPERDDDGRFISDRDRGYRGGRFSPSRESYGRGGRYGDDDRRYGWRGGRYEDDDQRYASDDGYGDDDQGRWLSRSGRHDDDRSYASDRRQGSWPADSRGRAEAADRGWDRGGYGGDDRYGWPERSLTTRYDSRRYASPLSRYDAERGYPRDRGRGGWFADPEGYPEEAGGRGWGRRRYDDEDGYYRRGR